MKARTLIPCLLGLCLVGGVAALLLRSEPGEAGGTYTSKKTKELVAFLNTPAA